MYTWGDIQIISIEKMFLNNTPIQVSDLSEMRDDKKYKNYLSAMPNVANEALLRIMSKGRPIIKKYIFNQNIPNSILHSQSYDSFLVESEDIQAFASVAHAYYFEIDNSATVLVEKFNGTTWEIVETVDYVSTRPGKYRVFKGIIDNPDNEQIRLVFKAQFIYNVRNIALYNVKFRTNEEVFDNVRRQKYNLNELIEDFYKIISVEYEENSEKGMYISNYDLEGDNVFVVDTEMKGNFIITYQAYPDKISASTRDDYRFNLPAEMILLLPLYISSELYKDDDISLATAYRNQFEAGLESLDGNAVAVSFMSNSGWL